MTEAENGPKVVLRKSTTYVSIVNIWYEIDRL